MDDNQNDKTEQEDSDDSAEVMDIDKTAQSVGLRSGNEDGNGPRELNTNQDLSTDQQNEWES